MKLSVLYIILKTNQFIIYNKVIIASIETETKDRQQTIVSVCVTVL
jgi:hypothetical protein